MKPSSEQFKIQLVKRPPTSQHRKHSADHRYRQRPKERTFTPSIPSDKFRQTISYDKEKSGCLNTIFQKELQTKSFAQHCDSLLNKKKSIQKDENQSPKKNSFNTMLQNIKNVIKENERKVREVKMSPQPWCQNQFHCVRSQIHQLYSNEEKIQLYRNIRTSESRNSNYKDKIKNAKPQERGQSLVTQSKPLVNPFANMNTIVCFTIALNDPNPHRKQQPLFEAPATRTIASAGISTRRTVSIGRPLQGKSMAFNLTGDSDGQYIRKLKNFYDFLFKVNFSNNIYVNLQMPQPDQTLNITRYKVYIGKGNNSLLVKSLMRRRFWWEICDNIDTPGINFYWTQNIHDKVQTKQKKTNKPEAKSDRTLRRRKDADDPLDLNRKILSLEKSKTVQSFITKNGFIIPFSETFEADMITNHLPRNYSIGSKKNLFKSLFNYFTNVKHRDPFDYIPKTYHIKSLEDPEYRRFVKQNQSQPHKVWIVKPGQHSNRGRGINLSSFSSIGQLLRKGKHENGQALTYIVQSYINRPFLYNNRKFDIRHYMMLTSVNGILKAYWYKEGYIRTSSQIFDLQEIDNEFIHLTNDAIQKESDDYQRYEPANKISYSEFQRYLDYVCPSKQYSLERDILPKMKEIANYIVKANYRTIDHRRHKNNFEIYGLDFMIDRQFKPWLIQVNYNPCLEVNCPVLQRVIPVMLQNSLRLGLDPLYPPTGHYPTSKRFYLSDNYLKNLKYELIFDEDHLKNPIVNDYDFLDQKEEEEEFQDEGHELNQLHV